MPKHCEYCEYCEPCERRERRVARSAAVSFLTGTLPPASGLVLLTFCFLLLVFSL